jgi:nitrite reductase/ring-hydroxylating ferredoxin subunit/uncharacterized membrane protein
MRSKARFRKHPLHPMLIAFPVAFGTGCLVADFVGRLGDWSSVWAVGAFLSVAAVVMGLVAAVPGLIDYLGVVPPNSSAKARATWHMGINVGALALIAVGCAFRDWHTLRPGWLTVIAEALGMGLMSYGGWMGATLVYRNQIAVDHRYAHAGKWKEVTVTGQPGEAVPVAAPDELKPGQMKLLHANGRRIVLARTDEAYVAFDDHCTHRGGSLAGGVMACGEVVCPWHGSTFDVRTGAVTAGPADAPIPTYRVEESADQVRLVLPG